MAVGGGATAPPALNLDFAPEQTTKVNPRGSASTDSRTAVFGPKEAHKGHFWRLLGSFLVELVLWMRESG